MKMESDLLEKAKRCAERNLAPFAQDIAKKLNVASVSIVGGAVRDSVLAAITNRNFVVKDFDVVCSNKPKIEKNKNVLWNKQNSLGGIKVGLDGVGVVDVFQYYTKNPETIIANTFDFNCNSLFYLNNTIFESLFFLHFVETSELFLFNPLKYEPARFIARALKFQIVFQERFGLKVKLNHRLVQEINSLTDVGRHDMQSYMKKHIEDLELQKRVWQSFWRIREH